MIASYKNDANELISKRVNKLSGDELRDSRLKKSIDELQKVVNFNGTECEVAVVAIAALVTDAKKGEFNSKHFLSALNQSLVMGG